MQGDVPQKHRRLQMSTPKSVQEPPAGNTMKQTVTFPNDNKAVVVSSSTAASILAALDLAPSKAVILVLGGAAAIDAAVVPRLTQLFGRGIARAAADRGAVIIDGGTQAGVMALMGEGVAGRGYKSPLIGVAPSGLVTYPGSPTRAGAVQLEPNHSHFVLTEGNAWGSETGAMFNLAKLLTAKAPGVAILAGGGPVSKDEVLRAVRQGLPLIVVEGSGGLADQIAAAWKQRATLPDDPVIAEIIADGDIHLHPLGNSVKGIERLIIREFGGDEVLMQAWGTFADYDLNANAQQKRFSAIQFSILIVGVAGTALAIVNQVFGPTDDKGKLQQLSWADLDSLGRVLWWILGKSLVLIPIVLTVLITAANRFKQGNKWLLLRSGAEAIKREIYRYRARAGDYKGEPYQASPEQQLSQKVEDVTRRTMRTEVNTSALVSYDKTKGFPPYMYAAKGGDDGFTSLTPDRYVEVRLGDQLNYFHKTSLKLEKRLKQLYWATFVIGGVGTYLAAVGHQIWIALTTAVVAAIGTYLGYRQTESSLTKYNQAATDLANVRAWWLALSAEEQAEQQNIDSLVDHTEQVLQSELDGWVQQMQNSLAELREKQAPPEKEDKGEKGDKGEKKQASTPVSQGPEVEDQQTKQPAAPPAPDPKAHDQQPDPQAELAK
jgi:hypothetical protein